MDTLQPAAKKPRKRSKSTSLKENSPSTEPGVAPDLNGENSEGKPKDEAIMEVQQPKDEKPKSDTESNEAPGKGRKRKASELRDNSLTEPIKKDTGKGDKEPAQETTEAPPEEKVDDKTEKVEEKTDKIEDEKEKVNENKDKGKQ